MSKIAIDKPKYIFGIGTVQPFIYKPDDLSIPFLWFGAPQYEVSKPAFTDSQREQAQPILDALNAGTMTEDEAREQLATIRW